MVVRVDCEACLCRVAVVVVGVVVARFVGCWERVHSSVVVVVRRELEDVVQPLLLCGCCLWMNLLVLVLGLEVGLCFDGEGVVGEFSWGWECFVVGVWHVWMRREVVLQLGLCEHGRMWVGCWSNGWLESCEGEGRVVVGNS